MLDTPLHPLGFDLRKIARGARLPEMAFVFPVAGGHTPRGAIDKVAGLEFMANGQKLAWKRDPAPPWRGSDVSKKSLRPAATSSARRSPAEWYSFAYAAAAMRYEP